METGSVSYEVKQTSFDYCLQCCSGTNVFEIVISPILFSVIRLEPWTCVCFINLCTWHVYARPLLLQWCQPRRRAVWFRRLWSGQSGAFGTRQHRHFGQWLPGWLRGCQEAGQAPLSPWRLQTLWRGQTPGQKVSSHIQSYTFIWWLDWKIKQ